MEGTPTNSGDADKTPSRTPQNRHLSAEPPSTHRSAVHTPLDRSASRDLLNSVRRGTTASGGPRAGNNNAPTPHAKLARRALNDRRTAMFTPGKNRRRSQMEHRETPMDILRKLGSTLASKSKPISSSSSSTSADTPPQRSERTQRRSRSSGFAPTREDTSDDEPLPKRPRFSLPIDQDDDDEEELHPPRMSDVTLGSVEFPRRYDPNQQLPRESMGSIRGSDAFGDNEPTQDVGRPPDYSPGVLMYVQTGGVGHELERIDDPTRRTTLGQDSTFQFEIPALDDPSETFRFSPPPMEGEETVPIVDEAAAPNVAVDAPEPVEDISDREPIEDIPDQDATEDIPDQEPIEDIPDQEPTEDIPDQEPIEDIPDQEAVDDISDREPIEDISDRSDEGGVPTGDAFSDRGDIEVNAPQQPEPRQQKAPVIREGMPRRQKNRISRHGIEYPSLPPAFVKRVGQTALQSSGISNPRISADTLTALTQASEWFFEQLGDDLGAYANHAKRKTVEESDVVMLMRRQRQIGSTSTMFSLAQKHLPRELLQELRMPLPQPTKKRRDKRGQDDEEGESIT